MQGVTKPATPGQKATLSVQVTADIKNRIDTAARADGCSQGAEITKIINWWFVDPGRCRRHQVPGRRLA
jgi:hypothetical protein